MRYADPRLIDHLASAYVLGTLAGGARRRFEGLRRRRADVALAVAEWEARLAPLAGPVPPVQAPARVWEGIAARTHPATPVRVAAGWWRPAGWGVAGLAAGLAAVWGLLAVAPGLLLTPEQAALRSGGQLPPSYVGLLTDAQGQGKLLVSSLRHGRVLTVKAIGPMAAPAQGKHLVLWAVPASGAPFVLGPAPATGTLTAELPASSEALLSKVTRLAVSLEDEPRPAAPGQVLYSGNCAKLW